jgi:hypothetical protein
MSPFTPAGIILPLATTQPGQSTTWFRISDFEGTRTSSSFQEEFRISDFEGTRMSSSFQEEIRTSRGSSGEGMTSRVFPEEIRTSTRTSSKFQEEIRTFKGASRGAMTSRVLPEEIRTSSKAIAEAPHLLFHLRPEALVEFLRPIVAAPPLILHLRPEALAKFSGPNSVMIPPHFLNIRIPTTLNTFGLLQLHF